MTYEKTADVKVSSSIQSVADILKSTVAFGKAHSKITSTKGILGFKLEREKMLFKAFVNGQVNVFHP